MFSSAIIDPAETSNRSARCRWICCKTWTFAAARATSLIVSGF